MTAGGITGCTSSVIVVRCPSSSLEGFLLSCLYRCRQGKYEPSSHNLTYLYLGFLHKLLSTVHSSNLQTTLGRNLASILEVPFISMDTIHWQPNWQQSTPEVFEAGLRNALGVNEDLPERSWVVEGNYASRGGNVGLEASTDIICM